MRPAKIQPRLGIAPVERNALIEFTGNSKWEFRFFDRSQCVQRIPNHVQKNPTLPKKTIPFLQEQHVLGVLVGPAWLAITGRGTFMELDKSLSHDFQELSV